MGYGRDIAAAGISLLMGWRPVRFRLPAQLFFLRALSSAIRSRMRFSQPSSVGS